MFFKIKALADAGVKVHLHAFTYGRKTHEMLEQFCHSVHLYDRQMNPLLMLSGKPFIVRSRKSDELLERLGADDHPILFEGDHTTFYIDHPQLRDKRKYLRIHNIESDYYRALSKVEYSIFKRLYLRLESWKLSRYHPSRHAQGVIVLSEKDGQHVGLENRPTHFIPPFHGSREPIFHERKRPFALYHANLTVGENRQALQFLLDEVFRDSSHRLMIYGDGMDPKMSQQVDGMSNVSHYEGPQDELLQLIIEAQVNVLPTFQSTGMKLKLLYSLFNGGHCLVNPPMVEGTGLGDLCEVAQDGAAMREALDTLMEEDFHSSAFEARRKILVGRFSNSKNAQKLIEVLFA